MSATFDRLFDCGLLAIEDDLTLCVSGRVRKLKDQAAAVLHLAKQYGSFVLANALALAEALEIEDGESRI